MTDWLGRDSGMMVVPHQGPKYTRAGGVAGEVQTPDRVSL